MTRTELWVGAVPPTTGWTGPLSGLEGMPGDGVVRLTTGPLDADPERAPALLGGALAPFGRRLDAVIVGADVLDAHDGRPMSWGVGAHWRAGWIEVADRVAGRILAPVARLQPGVREWSESDPGQWDPHHSDRRAAWVQALAGRITGPGLHVLRSRAPLDAARWLAWCMTPWPGVVRAQGFVWTADQPEVVASFSRVGDHVTQRGVGRWWVGSPQRTWPRDSAALSRIQATWDADYGDREVRIAVLGPQLDPDVLNQRFSRCLIGARARQGWQGSALLPDPFAGRA